MGFWLFVGKYWLEFLFGLIAAGATGSLTWVLKLYKSNKKLLQAQDENKLFSKIENLIDTKINHLSKEVVKEEKKLIAEDSKLEKKLDDFEESLINLKSAMLSFFKDKFKKHCNQLLEQETISLEQYEWISGEHTTYNGLGGNHEGDDLFSLVREKYKNQL